MPNLPNELIALLRELGFAHYVAERIFKLPDFVFHIRYTEGGCFGVPPSKIKVSTGLSKGAYRRDLMLSEGSEAVEELKTHFRHCGIDVEFILRKRRLQALLKVISE